MLEGGISYTLYPGLACVGKPSHANSPSNRSSLLPLGLHCVSESLVVEQTLDGTNSADGDVAVPELPAGKVHDLLLGDGIDHALDLAGLHAAASGDELATNILSDGGGAVEGEEDGGLKLSLGALNLGGADVGAETHPLADGEVDEIVKASDLVSDKEDTPQTVQTISHYPMLES